MSPFSDGVSARPWRSADGHLTRFHRKHGSGGSSRSIASTSDYPLRNKSCTPSLLLQVLLAVAADKLAAHVVPLLSRSCGRLAPLSRQLSGPCRSRLRDGPSQFSAPLYRAHALVFTASLRSATRNTVRSNVHNLLISSCAAPTIPIRGWVCGDPSRRTRRSPPARGSHTTLHRLLGLIVEPRY